MKGILSFIALGLLAVDGATASRCRPSKPASSSSAVSSVSSASSSSSVVSSSNVAPPSSSSSVPASSSTSSPSIAPSSSSPVPSSSSAAVSSSSSVAVSSSSSVVVASSSSASSSSSSSFSSASAAPSAPCTNLIVDGDFSDSLNGWTVSAKGTGSSFGTYTCTPSYPDCGYMSVNSAQDQVDFYQIVNIVSGVEYTFNVDYLLQALSSEPVEGQVLCNFYPLQVVSPKAKRSEAVSAVAAMSFTIDMHSEGTTNGTITQRSPHQAAHFSPAVRRQTEPTFTNYHDSFMAPATGYQLDCSFTATGHAEVSLAAMILQPATCFTSYP